ncbi:hypothetical protein RD792_010111 [Penstemon davidsonii]|uniref:Polyamine transporter n=1 Tax=Penstemon davidsonii TaxID=160366 RepID=A0ABR0D2B5_9LAMI|nr:hypothetical protein RD792_010111 [Penstemon davidsonii]
MQKEDTQPPQLTTTQQLPTTTVAATTTTAAKKLNLIPLIFIIYFEVAGGPDGEEPAVQAVGPLFAILGFLIFPFIWSFPEALITAELSTCFPGNGGFVIWADSAFGSLMGEVNNPRKTFPLALFFAVILTCLSYIIPLVAVTGAMAVDQNKWEDGFMADAVAGGPYGEEPAVQAAGPLFAILGFLIFPFIWSIPEALITAELSTSFPGNGGFVIWADSAFGPFFGSLMGEVDNPRKTFPLALFFAVILTCLGYIIPLVAVTGAVAVDQNKWETGFMADADLAFLPSFFGARSKWFNTPWVGILVSTVIALCFSFMSYKNIVALANFLYSLGMLLEFASFLWLRRKMPQKKRPYKVPLSMPFLVVMCLIPSGFLVFIMFIANKIVYLVSGVMTVAGVGWYFLMKYCKLKGWFKFS